MKKEEVFQQLPTTVISANTLFEGNITFEGSLRVDGKVIGNINGDGAVEIGSAGAVKGNISAKTVVISGIIVGDINANERVEIISSAKIVGNITTPTILIEQNAAVEGLIKSAPPTMKDELDNIFSTKEKPTTNNK